MIQSKKTIRGIVGSVLVFYALTVAAMDEVRIDMPSAATKETQFLSNKAVELYFRGNAKSLHALLLPFITFKLQEAQGSPKENPVISDLKDLSIYGSRNVPLTDHIHALVTESIEEALKEKELELKQRDKQTAAQRKQRNIAIATALVTIIGGIGAALSNLTQLT